MVKAGTTSRSVSGLSRRRPRHRDCGIERAKAAECSALVVTIGTAVAGLRERDFRNGTGR